MLINGAQGSNVFFVVGSSATLGSTTAFTGRILALTSISLNDNATITCGAALARNGAVTLISNTISIPDDTCMVALAAGQQMMERGYLDSREMANMFSLLRSNDLIWANVVNNYLLGNPPPASTCSTGTATAPAWRGRRTAGTCATPTSRTT